MWFRPPDRPGPNNNWPDLELAISSALQQSYSDVEVILVDNQSTDGSLELARSLRDGLQAHLRIGLPLRAAEVGREHHF